MSSFVNDELDLVLFLNSRNRIRFYSRDALRNYVHRRRSYFARKCQQENVQETVLQQKFKNVIGLGDKKNWCGAQSKPLKVSRDLIKYSPWSLAPNRYDVPVEIYANRKGAGGAYWPKLPTSKSILAKPPEKRPRYNIAFYRKGARWLFPGNARFRRPTLRLMVSTLQGCYKDPREPGPTNYFPRLHLLEHNISPPTKTPPPNPHIFLRNSCVPQKTMSLIPRHISMDPAPGRYESRYRVLCACSSKLMYMPGLRLYVDQQKRNRFRGLPYERIKARLYCDPEWRHVIGNGHRYLFKVPRRSTELKLKAVSKGSDNMRLKMFHDSRYISMILHPTRFPISWRSGAVPELPLRIKYNSLAKRVIRKQLRNNKKIAFNSGQDRWKDGYRLPILTYAQQQAAKMTLPPERQLRDQPITRVSLSKIQTKLAETPKHLLPTFMPELRKRLFKFLPLPGAKVLVTEKDTRPDMIDGKYQCENYYGREILPEHYFLDPAQRRQSKDDGQRYDEAVQKEPEEHEEAATEGAEYKKEGQEPKVRLSQSAAA